MESSLEMKLNNLLTYTTKARVYSAITSIGRENSRYGVSRVIDSLHVRLMNCIRAPFLVRHSLQDILDEIEVVIPVDDDLDVSWILEDNLDIPDFVEYSIPFHNKTLGD